MYHRVFRQLGLLLIRFYTVRHYVCIFWTRNSMVMSPCLNFRVITEMFWGSQFFVFYGIHTGLYFDCSSSSEVSWVLLRSQKTRKSVCYRKQDKSFTTNLERENLEIRYEPHHEETCLRGFRPGETQTNLRLQFWI